MRWMCHLCVQVGLNEHLKRPQMLWEGILGSRPRSSAVDVSLIGSSPSSATVFTYYSSLTILRASSVCFWLFFLPIQMCYVVRGCFFHHFIRYIIRLSVTVYYHVL